MTRLRLALALVLVLVLAGITSTKATRQLHQGRSETAPGLADDSELRSGRPEELQSLAAQLQGPNAAKFLLPGAASEFARDSFVVQTLGATAEQTEAIMSLVRGRAVKVTDLHGPAFQGFALQLPPGLAQQSEVLQELIDSALVTAVEADITMHAVQAGTQNGAPWGLDRIDQTDLPLNNIFTYANSASDVTAFIVDTGIWLGHTEFEGRATQGFDAFKRGAKGGDCNGHGTHVAGTVGGKTYGVAKKVRLVAIRVLDCRGSGSFSGVAAGLNEVVRICRATSSKKCVANLSLGGGASDLADSAVAGAVDNGVVVVVAAGNSNADACGASPAREPKAITVGATTNTDARASWSNYGSCVDIFAPGQGILSANQGRSNTATATWSGTSMASPHVAGVVALHLSSSASPPINAAAVATDIFSQATLNKVTGAGVGTPNRLLRS